MNRDINRDENFGAMHNYSVGEQPRKSAARKGKKIQTFKKFEREFDEIDKDRHSYKRASTKTSTRAQLRDTSLLF